jgi:hypothetical protein
MPLSHVVDHQHRIITISGRGGINDAVDSAAHLLHDQTVTGDYSLLYHVAESEPLDGSALMQVGELLKLVLGRFTGRVAVAAPGVGQMTPAALVTLFADDGRNRIRIFGSEAEALVWLRERSPT